MKYKNEFIIHTTKQLIDINKGLTNFKANINIVSNNQDDDFDIVILTQKDLDNVDFDINYKNIIHSINIDVESTNNTQNQYVLVIKANNKTTVNIEIDLIDYDAPPPPPPPPPPPQPPVQMAPKHQHPPPPPPPKVVEKFEQKTKESKPNYLLYIGLLLVFGLFVYYLFFYNSSCNNKKKETIKNNTESYMSDDDFDIDNMTFDDLKKLNTEDTVKIDNNKIEVKTTEVDTTTRSMNEETLLDKLRNLRN